jgi:hypothetical protein
MQHAPRTYLNFFKGFEYDPTPEAAIVRSGGVERVKVRGRRHHGAMVRDSAHSK